MDRVEPMGTGRDGRARVPVAGSHRLQLGTVAKYPRFLLSVVDDLRASGNSRDRRAARRPGEVRHRCRITHSNRDLPGVRDGRFARHVALMAGVDGAPQTKGSRAWLGRVIALVVLASAIGLAIWTIYVLDRRPRTHDAHLFAYSSGIAPEVSGQIVALHVTNNQRVKKDQPLVDIDSEPFELRVRQARAQVAALK